jgi:5-(carboxyamino)imidazole ribonucleotide synthase
VGSSLPLPPGSLIGIVGGGQLGRMLALAGIPLGYRFRFLEPAADPPVQDLGEVVTAPYDDQEGLDRFARGLSAATYEFENVPVDTARRLARLLPVHPAPPALEMAQDRLVEKEGFRRFGIGTAPFRAVDSLKELEEGVEALGLPCVLKTRRFGYDGKGQKVLKSPGEVEPAWERLGGRPLILEGFVDFRRELSVLAVRGHDGETACYPVVENAHADGILRESRAPASGVSAALQEEARVLVNRVLEGLGYVGVLAVELFDTSEGLLANEMAPRVHNSGHWTQDGAVTSQFENHVRAVAGLPLGSTEALGFAAMVNLIGTVPAPGSLLELPGVHLHLYGKAPRPDRKLGHVNLRADSKADLGALLEEVRKRVGGG